MYTAASLLPETWFTDAPMLLLIAVAVVAMVLVIKGADWLVEAAAAGALRLGMSKIVIGATIVSLGTTSPECAVSVMAAWSGNSGLALGNGVGSIIADTGLIFGLGCLMGRLPADRFILSRQGWVQVGSGIMLAAICYAVFWLTRDQGAPALHRWVGILFVSLLAVYLVLSVRWSRQHSRSTFDADEPADATATNVAIMHTGMLHDASARSWLALIGMGTLGLLLVILGSDALVNSSSVVAVRWGVPQTVIAATFVAFGTSLPELVIGLTAVRKGHPELLIGNIIGADILNVLFVIGFAALAQPLMLIEPDAARPAIFLELHLPTMLIMLLLFRYFIFRANRTGYFERWMGVPMIALYVGYVVIQYAVSLR